MEPHDGIPQAVLLALIGILVSILLAVASIAIAMLCIGIVVGVLGSPLVRRASAWLTRYLEQ